MFDIRGFFAGPLESLKRMKGLVMFFMATHVVFLVFGQWMVAKGYPTVVELRETQLKAIQELMYLKPLTGALAESLVLKILYTFFFNLSFGAFLSTTLGGVLFFLPYVIAVWRAFVIGMLVQGLAISPLMAIVFYATFALEFSAYGLSSAIGTDFGLTLLWPGYRRRETRKEALPLVIKDGARLYVFVIMLLFIGAVWEIGWLHYLGPLIPPPVGK